VPLQKIIIVIKESNNMFMSKIVAPLLAILLTLFPNCFSLQMKYKSITFDRGVLTEKIIDAINERDIMAIEKLMCLNIKENEVDLSGKISELIETIGGKIIDFHWTPRGSYSGEKDGKRIAQSGWDIYFSTSVGKYRLHIDWEVTNNFSLEETGIRMFLLFEEIFPDYPVLGNIMATEGVEDWHG
jgi:hypothetical protein